MRLFLTRHAVSEANLDKSVNARLPDSRVKLAPAGHVQATAAGDFLAKQLVRYRSRSRIITSPYERTRETARRISVALDIKGIDYDYREEVALREISFGLFDGLTDDEIPWHFPREHAYYQKHVEFEGEFYAPMPMGESRVQVADRVKGMFGTIHRDVDHGIENFIIVSHGVTIRAFIMQWMHLSPEDYQAMENPNNASVTLIESTGLASPRYQLSTVFEGFPKLADKQAHREDGLA